MSDDIWYESPDAPLPGEWKPICACAHCRCDCHVCEPQP